MRSLLTALLRIGDRPDDPENVLLMHHFLVAMGVFMSVGGLIWGSISLTFGLVPQSVIPFSYTLLTVINFYYFRRSKNFHLARFFQVLISLLLPFMFQWSLGGFVVSGAVMLWAMLALAASFTFQSAWLNVRWLAAFLALTVVSGIIEPYMADSSDVISQSDKGFRLELDLREADRAQVRSKLQEVIKSL